MNILLNVFCCTWAPILLSVYPGVELSQAKDMLNFSRQLQVALQIGSINFHFHGSIQQLA